MRNYWSCTAFADKLRATVKPQAATSEGWDDWNATAKANYPIRFWLAEEALDSIQKVIYSPYTTWRSVNYWIINRYITATHTLSSKLKKGQWYDLDTRMLNCLFDELVNFVEIETASSHIAWSDKEDRAQYETSHVFGWIKRRPTRCPKAGIDHLNWAASLTFNEDWVSKDDPKYGKPTRQALAATEILELYNWWIVTRPNRPDAYDVSGWSAICDAENNNGLPLWGNRTPEFKKSSRAALKIVDKIEKSYDKEDENMLIKLIKVRKSLWT